MNETLLVEGVESTASLIEDHDRSFRWIRWFAVMFDSSSRCHDAFNELEYVANRRRSSTRKARQCSLGIVKKTIFPRLSGPFILR